jgi:hypothetical protein
MGEAVVLVALPGCLGGLVIALAEREGSKMEPAGFNNPGLEGNEAGPALKGSDAGFGTIGRGREDESG